MKVNIGPYNNVDDSRPCTVHIDESDVYSADTTLGLIILPMLKKVRDLKQGAPYVEPSDVPEELRPTVTDTSIHSDDTWHQRWDYVIGEMIWAFETMLGPDWEEQFWSGVQDIQFKPTEDGHSEMVYGPNHTYKCDKEGLKAFYDRMQNGFRLFGVYYQSLWV